MVAVVDSRRFGAGLLVVLAVLAAVFFELLVVWPLVLVGLAFVADGLTGEEISERASDLPLVTTRPIDPLLSHLWSSIGERWAERWLADPIVAVDSLFRLDEVGYESFCPFRSRSAGPPKSARKKSLGDRPMG